MSRKPQVEITPSVRFRAWAHDHDQRLFEIARETGIDRTILSRFYHGQTERLSWHNATRLSRYTGISLEDLGYVP